MTKLLCRSWPYLRLRYSTSTILNRQRVAAGNLLARSLPLVIGCSRDLVRSQRDRCDRVANHSPRVRSGGKARQ